MSIVILRLANELKTRGHHVEIILTCEAGDLFIQAQQDGLPVVHIPGYAWSIPVLHALRVGQYLQRQHYDVLLVNNDKPTHAILAQLHDDSCVMPVLHNDHRTNYRTAAANAQAWNVAIAVSDKLRHTFAPLAPARPIVTIENGVAVPEATAWASRAVHQLPLQLLFVGRLEHRQKGVLLLPEILAGCRTAGYDVRLTIIGEGNDEAALRTKAAEYDCAAMIRWCKHLREEQVYQVMFSAHVLLFPSYFEGFPLTLLEAAVCGCVPVAHRLPGITEHAVRDGITAHLVEIEAVPAMVAAIGRLYRDPAHWQSLSSEGHQFVMEHYTVPTMADRYLQLMQQVRAGAFPLPSARHTLPRLTLAPFSSRDFFIPAIRGMQDRLFRWVRQAVSGKARKQPE